MGYNHRDPAPYEPGLNSVGQYQMSGVPWLSGGYIGPLAESRIQLPYISKSITVKNTGSVDVRLHFANSGSWSQDGEVFAANPLVIDNYRYFTIESGATFTYDVRCNDFWLSNPSQLTGSGVELAVEQTQIDRNRMPFLTGSGINQ